MITLTQEEREFVRDELKPFLIKDDIKGAVQRTMREGDDDNFNSGNVIAFMFENDIDIFEGIDVVPATIFAHSNIESIEIPEGIREIQRSAFNNCAELTSVKLPSTLVKIGEHAFSECPKLLSLDIPESVTSIGHACFGEDNRIKLTTPKRTTGKLKLRIPSNEVDWYKAHLKTIAEPDNNAVGSGEVSAQEMYDFLATVGNYSTGVLSMGAASLIADKFNGDLQETPNLKLDKEWFDSNAEEIDVAVKTIK